MKYLMIVFALAIFGCASTQKSDENLHRNNNPMAADTTGVQSMDTIRISNDELGYEIIILDVGFNAWLATQRPMWYYYQPTLEVRNQFYVVEWNNRVNQPFRYDPNLYQFPIDYRADIDYGMEVNYMLYMYFQFFQQRYNQNLGFGRGQRF